MQGVQGRFQGVQMDGRTRGLVLLFLDRGVGGDQGLPIHHWNRVDISKLLVKFAHIIDIHEDTNQKTKLDCARVKTGCDNLAVISSQITVVMGRQLYTIKCKIVQNYRTISSVGLEGVSATGKINSDQPSTEIVSLPARNRRNYTEKSRQGDRAREHSGATAGQSE